MLVRICNVHNKNNIVNVCKASIPDKNMSDNGTMLMYWNCPQQPIIGNTYSASSELDWCQIKNDCVLIHGAITDPEPITAHTTYKV